MCVCVCACASCTLHSTEIGLCSALATITCWNRIPLVSLFQLSFVHCCCCHKFRAFTCVARVIACIFMPLCYAFFNNSSISNLIPAVIHQKNAAAVAARATINSLHLFFFNYYTQFLFGIVATSNTHAYFVAFCICLCFLFTTKKIKSFRFPSSFFAGFITTTFSMQQEVALL